MINISRITGTGINEMLAQVDKSGPTFEALGYNLEQSMYLMGKFDQELGKPAGERLSLSLGNVTEHLGQMGFNDTAEGWKYLIKTVNQFYEAGNRTGGIDFLTQLGIKGKAAGAVWKSITEGAMRSVEDLERMKNAEGNLDQPLNPALEKTRMLKDAMEQLSNSMKAAFAGVGVPLVHVLVEVADKVQEFVEHNQSKILGWAETFSDAIFITFGSMITEMGDAIKQGAPAINTFFHQMLQMLLEIDMAAQKFLDGWGSFIPGSDVMKKALVDATVPIQAAMQLNITDPTAAIGDVVSKFGRGAVGAGKELHSGIEDQKNEAQVREGFSASYLDKENEKQFGSLLVPGAEGLKLGGDADNRKFVVDQLRNLGITFPNEKEAIDTGKISAINTNKPETTQALIGMLNSDLLPAIRELHQGEPGAETKTLQDFLGKGLTINDGNTPLKVWIVNKDASEPGAAAPPGASASGAATPNTLRDGGGPGAWGYKDKTGKLVSPLMPTEPSDAEKQKRKDEGLEAVQFDHAFPADAATVAAYNAAHPFQGIRPLDSMDGVPRNLQPLVRILNGLGFGPEDTQRELREAGDYLSTLPVIDGVMNAFGMQAPDAHAAGGDISSDIDLPPGLTPPNSSDTMLSWLTPGEFVVNKNSSAAFHDVLQKINSAPHFNAGGGTSSVSPSTLPGQLGLPAILLASSAPPLDGHAILTSAGIPDRYQNSYVPGFGVPGVSIPTDLSTSDKGAKKSVQEIMDTLGVPSNLQDDKGITLPVSFSTTGSPLASLGQPGQPLLAPGQPIPASVDGEHPQITAALMAARTFGLGTRGPGVDFAGERNHPHDGKLHPQGEAGDFSGGSTEQMDAFANAMMSPQLVPYIQELIRKGPGVTQNILGGKLVPAIDMPGSPYVTGGPNGAGDHTTHVHLGVLDNMAQAFEQALGATGIPANLSSYASGASAGFPGMGTGTVDSNLMSALQSAGIPPEMYPLLVGFAKTEGNNGLGIPTLGFKDVQAGSTLEGHVMALAKQLQDRQSVVGPFPAGGSPQDQAAWMADVVGQNGVQSDIFGERQPAREEYINSIVKNFGGVPTSLSSYTSGGALPHVSLVDSVTSDGAGGAGPPGSDPDKGPKNVKPHRIREGGPPKPNGIPDLTPVAPGTEHAVETNEGWFLYTFNDPNPEIQKLTAEQKAQINDYLKKWASLSKRTQTNLDELGKANKKLDKLQHAYDEILKSGDILPDLQKAISEGKIDEFLNSTEGETYTASPTTQGGKWKTAYDNLQAEKDRIKTLLGEKEDIYVEEGIAGDDLVQPSRRSPKKGEEKYNTDAESLGKGLVKGLAEELGFGDIFKNLKGENAKPPWEWGIWKSAMAGIGSGIFGDGITGILSKLFGGNDQQSGQGPFAPGALPGPAGPNGPGNLGLPPVSPGAHPGGAPGAHPSSPGGAVAPHGKPLFTREGGAGDSDESAQLNERAYEHNAQYATKMDRSGKSYNTHLSPEDETAFRAWLKSKSIKKESFDPDKSTNDYDMRGFWKYNHVAANALPAEESPDRHFPDTWKTPFDTSFSGESNYANSAAESLVWEGDLSLIHI